MAAIAGADACFGAVWRAVEATRSTEEDTLLIACSDHGHQSVDAVIDIDAAFVAAGLKRGRRSEPARRLERHVGADLPAPGSRRGCRRRV